MIRIIKDVRLKSANRNDCFDVNNYLNATVETAVNQVTGKIARIYCGYEEATFAIHYDGYSNNPQLRFELNGASESLTAEVDRVMKSVGGPDIRRHSIA